MLVPHEVVKKAKAWYDKNHPGLFEELLIRCVAWGVVVKTSDTLFLAEPVWTDGKAIKYDGEREPNCWWIHMLYGKLDIPYLVSFGAPMEYVGWERNNERVRDKMKIHKWERGSRGYGKRS